VKAVNLVPGDSRRGRMSGTPSFGPGMIVLALLAVAVGFVTLYVVTTNTISERQAKLSQIQAQTTQEQAVASRLADYAAFAKLAQKRSQTVRQIAAARFDWHSALSNLSKVFPPQTSLASLFGSSSSDATVSGSNGSSTGGSASALRGYSAGPAFELSGCTKSHDDVANLMSRLRVMPGVTRVTLGNSTAHTGSSSAPSSSSSTPAGCGANAPTFNMLVFYQPIPTNPATPDTAGTGAPAASSPAPASP
jgi:Tfp pilus assembly protein PilN